MRFVILNYSNLEYVKSICDNLFKIANKRPTVINYNDYEIPNCDLIILPDEFLGLEKIIKKVFWLNAIIVNFSIQFYDFFFIAIKKMMK